VVCPRPVAAFRLQLTAPSALPSDTRIEVSYQGSQTESFDLSKPEHHEDVCCRLAEPVSGALPHVPCGSQVVSRVTAADAGVDARTSVDGSVSPMEGGADAAPEGGPHEGGHDASAPNLALQCELWTNGPANLHVTARGYAALDEDLRSKLRGDNCGVDTEDVRFGLTPLDGG